MADTHDLEATRLLIDLLADKWTVPVLGALCAQNGRMRFNALRRALPAVSQKSLVACLKRLEHSGLLERHVSVQGPLAVEYRVTPLGHTIEAPVEALIAWSKAHAEAVTTAQKAFEAREAASA